MTDYITENTLIESFHACPTSKRNNIKCDSASRNFQRQTYFVPASDKPLQIFDVNVFTLQQSFVDVYIAFLLSCLCFIR